MVTEKILTALRKNYPGESDRTLMELVAYDDVFSVLKNGASALWSARHALFP